MADLIDFFYTQYLILQGKCKLGLDYDSIK